MTSSPATVIRYTDVPVLAACAAAPRASRWRLRRSPRGAACAGTAPRGRSVPRLGHGAAARTPRPRSSASAPKACCASPRPSRSTQPGDVYVADQLSYVVQKFNAAGEYLETEWGSYGGGHGQFGPIGGLATDAAGRRVRRRLQPQPDREVRLQRQLHHRLGPQRQRTRPVQLRLLAEPHPAAGRRDRGRRQLRVRRRLRQRPHRALQPQGGEAMQWGSYGQRARPVLLPARRRRQRNRGDRLRRRQPPHREVHARTAPSKARSAHTAPDRGSSASPTASRSTRPATCTSPTTSTTASSSSTPQLGFAGAWGGFGSKPGQLAFPRALASDPAGDTYVADTANDRIEVFDPSGDYLRTLGISGARPGALTAPRGLAIDPTGAAARVRHGRQPHRGVRPGSERAARRRGPRAGGHSARLRRPAGIGDRPARRRCTSPTNGNARLVRLWGDGTFLSELGGPADLGGAGLSGASSVAVAAAPGDVYVADTDHNRVLVYGPEGLAAGAVGRRRRRRRRPAARPARSTIPRRSPSRRRATSTSPTPATTASSSSRPDGAVLDRVGLARHGRRALPRADRGRRRRRRAGVRRRQRKQPRRGVRPKRALPRQVGRARVGPGEFSQPTAIAVDCDGDVYVADTNNNRVERFDPVSPAGAGCLRRRQPGRRRWTSRRCCTSACRAAPAVLARGARSR